jgi:hypothetical protein
VPRRGFNERARGKSCACKSWRDRDAYLDAIGAPLDSIVRIVCTSARPHAGHTPVPLPAASTHGRSLPRVFDRLTRTLCASIRFIIAWRLLVPIDAAGPAIQGNVGCAEPVMKRSYERSNNSDGVMKAFSPELGSLERYGTRAARKQLERTRASPRPALAAHQPRARPAAFGAPRDRRRAAARSSSAYSGAAIIRPERTHARAG